MTAELLTSEDAQALVADFGSTTWGQLPGVDARVGGVRVVLTADASRGYRQK